MEQSRALDRIIRKEACDYLESKFGRCSQWDESDETYIALEGNRYFARDGVFGLEDSSGYCYLHEYDRQAYPQSCFDAFIVVRGVAYERDYHNGGWKPSFDPGSLERNEEGILAPEITYKDGWPEGDGNNGFFVPNVYEIVLENPEPGSDHIPTGVYTQSKDCIAYISEYWDEDADEQ